MMRLTIPQMQLAAAATGFTITVAAGLWLWVRQRPTADEIERRRRMMLVTFGRLVDGLLIDTFELPDAEGQARQMLLFTYAIAGVSYECSQDITTLVEVLEPGSVKVGMPCSIRYQPGSPENSILVAENWSGLRNRVNGYPDQHDSRAAQRREPGRRAHA